MANNDGGLNPESIQNSDHVPYQVKEGVLVDGCGAFRLPVPSHIRCHSTKSGLRERGKLMTPGVGRLWKTVTEEDNRPFPLFGDMNPDSVCYNHSMFEF